MKNLILLVVLLLVTTGCTQRVLDFTIVSSKNVDTERMSSFITDTKRAKGIDKAHVIVFVPTGNPQIKEALDRAIESVPGAVAMLDGVISFTSWWIPYVYGQSYYSVEGTALIDPELLTSTEGVNEPGDYNLVFLGNDGKKESTIKVSKHEYEEILKQRM